MKIAFISDTHFGFGRGTERERDAWEAVEEAVSKIHELECDLIVHAGDMFDTKLPRPEDWSQALQIFSKLKVPLVAIHGNHERRGRGLTNPVEGLSRGGDFDYVNANCKTYHIKNKTIAIHGIGWVPEAYAADVLKQWNPKPVRDAYNVLVLHQSVRPFIYSPIEPPSLRLEDMPPGFDLYTDGHVHEHQVTTVNGKPFVVIGSTVTTQVNKAEAQNGKGFVVVDVEEDKATIQKIPLKSARHVFYHELGVDDHKPNGIKSAIENYLETILNREYNKKPLIRIRVTGRLPSGVSFSDVDLRGVREAYSDRCVLSIGSKLHEEVFDRAHVEIREQRLSLDELGFKLLRDFLKQQNSEFKFEDIFEHLVDGDAEAALVTLLSERVEPQKTVGVMT